MQINGYIRFLIFVGSCLWFPKCGLAYFEYIIESGRIVKIVFPETGRSSVDYHYDRDGIIFEKCFENFIEMPQLNNKCFAPNTHEFRFGVLEELTGRFNWWKDLKTLLWDYFNKNDRHQFDNPAKAYLTTVVEIFKALQTYAENKHTEEDFPNWIPYPDVEVRIAELLNPKLPPKVIADQIVDEMIARVEALRYYESLELKPLLVPLPTDSLAYRILSDVYDRMLEDFAANPKAGWTCYDGILLEVRNRLYLDGFYTVAGDDISYFGKALEKLGIEEEVGLFVLSHDFFYHNKIVVPPGFIESSMSNWQKYARPESKAVYLRDEFFDSRKLFSDPVDNITFVFWHEYGHIRQGSLTRHQINDRYLIRRLPKMEINLPWFGHLVNTLHSKMPDWTKNIEFAAESFAFDRMIPCLGPF